MPMTPFMGVLTSWLMLARNSLLSRVDSRARAVVRSRLRKVVEISRNNG